MLPQARGIKSHKREDLNKNKFIVNPCGIQCLNTSRTAAKLVCPRASHKDVWWGGSTTPLIINTFAASYLNTQGLNNSCLKSRQLRP